MTLNQIAQQAMDYLDSVGVAADYEIKFMRLEIFTDDKTFTCAYDYNISEFMDRLRNAYPQKKPCINRVFYFKFLVISWW